MLVVLALCCFSPLLAQQGGYALQFDGSDDYVNIPHHDSFSVSAITIEMWFYWENTTVADDVDFLIGKGLEQFEIHTGGRSGNHGLRFIPTANVLEGFKSHRRSMLLQIK